MQSLAEKRVYGEQGGARSCLVASETGLVHVRVTGTAVGEFSLVDRRPAGDVAVGPSSVPAGKETSSGPGEGSDPHAVSGTREPTIAVATETDVRSGDVPTADGRDTGAGNASAALSDALEPTGFGPAVTVDVGSDAIVAAAPDGDVRRLELDDDGSPTDRRWRPIDGPAGVTVAAIDTPLVATDRGVYRIVDDTLRPAGLADVRDVDSTEIPLAATASGLYTLGNGWQSLLDEATDGVSATPSPEQGSAPRIHVVSGSTLSAVDAAVQSSGRLSADEATSHTVARADEPLADLAHGPAGHVYAITETGTVLAAGPDEVRRHVLGVRGVTAMSFYGPETRSEHR